MARKKTAPLAAARKAKGRKPEQEAPKSPPSSAAELTVVSVPPAVSQGRIVRLLTHLLPRSRSAAARISPAQLDVKV